VKTKSSAIALRLKIPPAVILTHCIGEINTLASQYGRYSYRRITALLRRTGWHLGDLDTGTTKDLHGDAQKKLLSLLSAFAHAHCKFSRRKR
jgi:hypothetical protein